MESNTEWLDASAVDWLDASNPAWADGSATAADGSQSVECAPTEVELWLAAAAPGST